MNAPSNNPRKPEICLSCETYSHLYACGLLFVKSDQSLFEASDILALKQTVLCRTVYSWVEIEISFEIAIFVGHRMVQYLQLYMVQPNITTLPRLKCSG